MKIELVFNKSVVSVTTELVFSKNKFNIITKQTHKRWPALILFHYKGNPPTALEKWRSQCVTWLWLKLKDFLQNIFYLPLSLEHEKHGQKSVGLHGR